MAEHFTKHLGTLGGRDYQLTIRVSPSFNYAKEFAVVVHYAAPGPAEREVQIARIDTSHGFPHFDRLYRRDRPKDPLDVDVWEAAALLEDHWRTYAERFDDVHDD